MRSLFFLLLVPALAHGQDKYRMEPGPKSPRDSLKCIQARPGFQVELVACEPAVMDPIAFAWGADGKFWVVEMGDYPLGAGAKHRKGGRIKILEKSKPGGMYDKATVFLDNLGYPTGVFPWDKGVLITCAPDILYAEDIDKDGRADRVVKLYTGFREGNQQHRVNGLVWGLDNYIYGANGDSGGTIKSNKMPRKEVNINGRDFRIDPENGDIEAVTGQSQFGRARDDWGNWFGNNNSNPMFHYVLEDRYLRRNPALLFTDVRVNVSEAPGAARVYPISKPLPRFNTPAAVNHFTSACSTIIYRDDLFGPDFEGNSFVAEPVHNLIHREIMRPEGVTFRSKRAADEKDSEFLASSDNWFRPAMIQTGPDGALWIADMYRYVIEHPEWIPKEWQAKLDLRAGHDKGRIYRVFPKEKKPREIPNLAKLDAKGLVAALDSPSGWQRDTAQRLLVEPDRKEPKNEDLLASMKSKRPQTRLHTLMVMEGLQRANRVACLIALEDPHPAVRKHAILIQETVWIFEPLKDFEKTLTPNLETEDAQVRLQLAYSMGESREMDAAKLLLRLAGMAAKDKYLSAAVLSSITKKSAPRLVELSKLQSDVDFPQDLTRNLIRFLLADKKDVPPDLFVRAIRGAASSDDMIGLATICDALDDKKSSLAEAMKSVGGRVNEKLNGVFDAARSVANNSKATLAERIAAVRLLGRGLTQRREDMAQLENLLVPATPDEVQLAVLQHLTRVGGDKTPTMLIKKWKHLTPNLRGPAFDTLTARAEWTEVTLVHLEAKTILPSELDAVRRQRLLNHRDKSTRVRAEKLLASTTTKDRAKAINDYLLALTLEGDAKKGAKIFMKSCATCHRVGDVGQDVGPELASVGDRTPGGLLSAILDPNRAVESRYLNYLATTKAGVTHVGILAAETSTSITLVAVDGKKTDILRGELEELTSTGKSAMPEGLEKDISPPEMADLLAYLTRALPPKLEPGRK